MNFFSLSELFNPITKPDPQFFPTVQCSKDKAASLHMTPRLEAPLGRIYGLEVLKKCGKFNTFLKPPLTVIHHTLLKV